MKRLTFLLVLLMILAGGLVPVFAGGGSAATQQPRVVQSGPLIPSQTRKTFQGWHMAHGVQPNDYKDMPFWALVEKETNIHIEWTEFWEVDAIRVRYAAQDFPDFAINPAIPNLTDFVEGNVLWDLTDMVPQYAPFMSNVLAENPLFYKLGLVDGRLYSLPRINFNVPLGVYRDMWVVNQAWLDTLGIQAPKNMHELHETLRKFRNAIDSGILPRNGVPMELILSNWLATANGAASDFINCFGMYIDWGFQMVNPATNTVYTPWIDEKIMEPVNWLNRFYRENLLTADSFSNNSNVVNAKLSSEYPGLIGITTFRNKTYNLEVLELMDPPYGPNGEKPALRRQDYSGLYVGHQFVIFKKCNDPETLLAWINHINADYKLAVQSMQGLESLGEVFFNADGTYSILTTEEKRLLNLPVQQTVPTVNAWSIMFTQDRVNGLVPRVNVPQIGPVNNANEMITDIWNRFNMPLTYKFPPLVPNDSQSMRMGTRMTEMSNHIDRTFSEWVTTDGVNKAKFDAYVNEMNRLGLREYLAVLQEMYNNFNR